MKRWVSIVAIAGFLSGEPAAQIRRAGEPASAAEVLGTTRQRVVLPAPDIAALRAEDAALGDWPGRPHRFGAEIPVSLGLESAGYWEEAPGSGAFVWRLELVSPGALSLNLLFDEFELPPGAQVFLYSPDRTHLLGAYTAENNKPNGMLAVEPIRGDALVIEYVQPRTVVGTPRLNVGQVVHAYRDVLVWLGGDGVCDPADVFDPDCLPEDCFLDVNCPEGAPYQDIKRSVVKILRGNSFCSGALLNNTRADGTPYVLTAWHCGGNANAVFFFGFERSTCGDDSEPPSNTVSGATGHFLVRRLDTALWELTADIPKEYRPFYAGWDRTPAQLGDTTDAPGVSISHPTGFPKKLALDHDAPLVADVLGFAGTVSEHWTVEFEVGGIIGGSSGSPLFNGRGRVLGAVSGPVTSNDLGTCGLFSARVGPLYLVWDATDMGQWLDPLGLGPTAIDGFDPNAAAVESYNGSGLNPEILTSVTLPELGTTWVARVDASQHPEATRAWLLGYAGPSAGSFFRFGELLVSPVSRRLFRVSGPVIQESSEFGLSVPYDALFAGRSAYVQSLLYSPLQGLAATNGLELRFDCP